MKINVIYNKHVLNYSEALENLERALLETKLEFKTFELNEMSNFGDFTIVIGGDGTLLRAAKFYSEWKVPVLGVNLGRLGFLSQVAKDEVKFLVEQIAEGNFTIEARTMLTSIDRLALNDFVIKGCDSSRTSKFYLEINGKEVCDYIADGLIVSTPTGSTAYGLSAGGPILYPTSDVLTIVPICPHTLNARPIVVPSTETVTVKTADKLLTVSIDGFDTEKCVDKITIKKSDRQAVLAFLKDACFYEVLRDKLHWGESILQG